MGMQLLPVTLQVEPGVEHFVAHLALVAGVVVDHPHVLAQQRLRLEGLVAQRAGGGRFLVVVHGNVVAQRLEWKLMSCSHSQKLGQLADLGSDWLFTLMQPIRSQHAC